MVTGRWRRYTIAATILPVSAGIRRGGVTGRICRDGHGNYNFGVEEQAIFPEINVDSIDKFRGMNITIVTDASTDEEGLELLKLIGMPFRTSSR